MNAPSLVAVGTTKDSSPPAGMRQDLPAAVQRAVLILTRHVTPATRGEGAVVTAARAEYAPPWDAPLVDRPVVQHIIERLAGEGVRQLDVLADPAIDDIDALRRFVSDNDRWGMHVRWLTGERPDDCEPLRRLGGEERLALVFADSLMLHSFADPMLHEGVVARLTCDAATPWAVIDGDVLELLPAACDLHGLGQWLADLEEIEVRAAVGLPAATSRQLLESQRRLLTRSTTPMGELDNAAGPHLIGRELQSGVRFCRNVRIHPSAQVDAPVFIGDNTRIGKGVHLGSNTVIGANCLIDHHARLENALVMEGTYIGPWVEMYDSLVQCNTVTNVRIGARVEIDDPLICGRL
ncbi:MAG: NDP-sugar synthase [Planctomycetales bacterium]|nr:NDP-sugar synthase [Planctomycetales bacterium]